MWRSKPSLRRTWLQRLSRVKWMRLLSGRILKPSMESRFVEKYTESLADIPASRSATPASEKERTTLDTFGRIYSNTSVQLDLFGASSKTSQDTSHLDSMRFSKAFEIWVTKLRQDCLRRQRLAHLTKESDCLSWPTPDTCPDAPNSGSNKKNVPKNFHEVINWLTPRANDPCENPDQFNKRMGDRGEHCFGSLSAQIQNWETPTVSRGGHTQSDGTIRPKLDQQVKNWPTPRTSEYKGTGPKGSKSQKYMLDKKYLCATVEEQDGQRAPDSPNTNGKNRGQLNPAWVEQLQGLPKNWTQLPTEWID